MPLVCPQDHTPLEPVKEHHIPHERCPKCAGGWFDLNEFERLEASAADESALFGTLEYAKRDALLNCPSCGKPMTAFDFRGHDLELDACKEEHGFWLDAGEVERVRSIMRERTHDLDRSARAQQAWDQERERGFSRNLVEKLRSFLHGG